jgi:hypothetical protein
MSRKSNLVEINNVDNTALETKISALKEQIGEEVDVEKVKEIINTNIKATDVISVFRNDKNKSFRIGVDKFFTILK